MPATQAKIKLTPRLADSTSVRVKGYTYVVDFGPDVKPRLHIVQKNGYCTCILGPDCSAVAAVRDYRKAGGEQAADAPGDYYFVIPDKCPICGARIYATGVVHPKKGVEWVCNANFWHYRQHHLKLVRQEYPQSPWRFPPVVVRVGIQLSAWDGVLPGDRVIYEGVLEEDVNGMVAACG